ncbi:hypothetical protein GCM10019059_07970 [Camelimonas fluminis]|uniref:Uncharacterized protein n=1 Tax=Camelimonas fluminis TaxID=1576911 RepID=A0ABV7UF71_9HYPH|nr:hypothetical protein [Camelimonas fluminis]GHE51153.1 hypothetical protein GCM10019059_07970 [Camelimonas fluminis]
MAKYTAKFSCGHTETVELYGPEKDRSRKLAWMADKVCDACYKAAKAVEAAGELPALEGSEKQVAWATEIRATIIADLKAQRAAIGAIAQRMAGNAAAEAGIAAAYAAMDAAAAKTAAAWWIDNRAAGRAAAAALTDDAGAKALITHTIKA